MQESSFERGKEEGNTALEKVRNWRFIIGLRMLGFFFFFFFFLNLILFNLNLTPKQHGFKTEINFNINSKTTSFWYQLKNKKKIQKYNVSILNPKSIRYPTSPSPSPINVSSSPLYFCLLTLCLRCYCCLLPPYYAV